jgi:predicted CopG family antitoxin
MSTDYKSIRLTVEAYETLEKRKREDETFSEAIERLARERPIRDLAGLFNDDEVEDIRSARTKSYEAYADRREREYET